MIKRIKKLAVIMMAIAVAFTTFPAMTGTLGAHAASPYWKNFKVVAGYPGETATKISWKKLTKAQQKKIDGITIFKDGKAIKNLKKSAKNYYDGDIEDNATYTYQVKTFKKTTKKVKMYWNKKTGKWQTKKIKKAKTKKVKKTTYKYKNASPVKTVKTIVYNDQEDDPVEPDDPTPENPTPSDPTPSEPTPTDPTPTPSEPKLIEITDYKDTVRQYEEGRKELTDPRYNREIDGIFIADNPAYVPDGKKAGESYFIQKNSITFYIDHSSNGCSVGVYNGDFSKLTLELDRPMYPYKKWSHALENPTYENGWYILGNNGRRLAEVEIMDKTRTRKLYFTELHLDTSTVKVIAKYDGSIVNTYEITFDSLGKAGSDGFNTSMRKGYNIAKEAVSFFENGGSLESGLQQTTYQALIQTDGKYFADMRAIMSYVGEKYTYSEIDCWCGYDILEAYSVVEYNEYGHWTNPVPSNTGHMAFRPDSYCEAGKFNEPGCWFDAAGHK